MGDLVSFGQLFETNISSPHFWTTFIQQLSFFINFNKKRLGYILVDFFKNSSGHPACQ
jgi:hypothetical protein